MYRLLILVLLIHISSFAQPKPDVVVQGLHGSVHSVRIDSRQGTKELQPESEQTFDSDGWITESREYGPEGKLKSINIFKRNGRRMIEADSTRYLPEDQAERIVTAFEEHGFPSQVVRYAPDGSVRERIVNDYQETEIRELHYDGSGQLVSTRTISTLHDPNSPDRHIEERVNGQPALITDLHQTADRVHVKQEKYNDGRLSEQIVRDIRSSGTSSATLYPDGSSWAASTRNEEFNQIINSDGSRWRSKFNEAGQTVEKDRYGASGKLTERVVFTYETDDHGNWTRRETRDFRENKLIGTATETRSISYY
jgi:hypothetical protein